MSWPGRMKGRTTRKPTKARRSAPQSDRLLAACRATGARLGIVFRTPLDAGGNGGVAPARRSDPVGDIARASRVRVRRVRLAGDWWEQDNGPLLAFLAVDERPVALTPAVAVALRVGRSGGGDAGARDAGRRRLAITHRLYVLSPFPAGAAHAVGAAALRLGLHAPRRLAGRAGAGTGRQRRSACSRPSPSAGSTAPSSPPPKRTSCCSSCWPC